MVGSSVREIIEIDNCMLLVRELNWKVIFFTGQTISFVVLPSTPAFVSPVLPPRDARLIASPQTSPELQLTNPAFLEQPPPP
jgi:hypothetical protein